MRQFHLLTDILSPLFNGLFSAMVVFLFATGLTLIFGILRVLNFAHGGFFMIGAYIAFSLVALLGANESMLSYLLISAVSGVALGLVGLAVERFVFRPLQKVDEAYSLIATYALLLITEGAVKAIWGVSFHSASAPSFSTKASCAARSNSVRLGSSGSGRCCAA